MAKSILSIALQYEFKTSDIIEYFSRGVEMEAGSIVRIVADDEDGGASRSFRYARILSVHNRAVVGGAADGDSNQQGYVRVRVYDNKQQLEEDEDGDEDAGGGEVEEFDFEDIKSEEGAYLTAYAIHSAKVFGAVTFPGTTPSHSCIIAVV